MFHKYWVLSLNIEFYMKSAISALYLVSIYILQLLQNMEYKNSIRMLRELCSMKVNRESEIISVHSSIMLTDYFSIICSHMHDAKQLSNKNINFPTPCITLNILNINTVPSYTISIIIVLAYH